MISVKVNTELYMVPIIPVALSCKGAMCQNFVIFIMAVCIFPLETIKLPHLSFCRQNTTKLESLPPMFGGLLVRVHQVIFVSHDLTCDMII